MNRENYSKKTLSTFQILSAYFTDQFYNHLFLKARDKHELHGNEETSLTQEYTKIVLAYKDGLCQSKNREYYSTTIKAILEYYRACTKYRTIGMNEFIDNVLSQFIPEEHFKILTIQEKYFFLNRIIVNVVLEFTRCILSIDMLVLVIDQHWKSGNADKCKEQLVDIMLIEREKLFSKFVKEELRKSGYRDMVDVELLDKLKADRDIMSEQFQKVLSEKCRLESENDKLKKIIKCLYDDKKNAGQDRANTKAETSRKLADKISQLERNNKKYMQEVAGLQKQNADLRRLLTEKPREQSVKKQPSPRGLVNDKATIRADDAYVSAQTESKTTPSQPDKYRDEPAAVNTGWGSADSEEDEQKNATGSSRDSPDDSETDKSQSSSEATGDNPSDGDEKPADNVFLNNTVKTRDDSGSSSSGIDDDILFKNKFISE